MDREKAIQKTIEILAGYPNFLWFCTVNLDDERSHNFTVYAKNETQAKVRVRNALEESGLQYKSICKPYRQRSQWHGSHLERRARNESV